MNSIPAKQIPKKFLTKFFNFGVTIADIMWPIVTVLSVGHMRGCNTLTCANIAGDLAQLDSLGGVAVGGFIDILTVIGSYSIGFAGGSIEGSLLSLTYPFVRKSLPGTYRLGNKKIGAHHAILPIYIFLNSALYYATMPQTLINNENLSRC